MKVHLSITTFFLIVLIRKFNTIINKYGFLKLIMHKFSFSHRYGTGFGIIGPILGEQSLLNLPNTIYGILFYLLTMALGMTYF